MLVADSSGIINGKFTVPPNIPAGTKLVTIQGNKGSRGSANYTGRAGILTTEERRKIITQTVLYYDPLAETFVPPRGFHFAGVDLKFHAKGSNANDVLLQLCEVDNGYPARRILGQGRLAATNFKTNGDWTTFLLDTPVFVEQDREYCFKLLTDDAVHAVKLAQLGKFDPVRGFVSGQPYTVGTMFSSSNNSAWTVHQDQDLTFRILKANFTQFNRTVSLGTLDATALTDLLVLAGIERPTPETQVELVFTRTDGSSFRVMEGQTVSFAEAITDDLTVTAILTGTGDASPVVYPNVQAFLGSLRSSDNYVTRAFAVGTSGRIAVRYQSLLTGTAAVKVEYQSGADPTNNAHWTEIAQTSSDVIGDGWNERSHVVTGITRTDTRIRLTLTGTALNRPRVRALRAVTTA